MFVIDFFSNNERNQIINQFKYGSTLIGGN